MITMALKGKIRALHKRDGKSISEIARRTSLSRNTIKKWLKAPAEAAPKYRREASPGKLAPFVATLTQALKADAHRLSVSLQSVTFDLSIGTTDPFIVSPAFGLADFRLGRRQALARPGT